MAKILRSYLIFIIVNIFIFSTNSYSQISISSSDILALKGTARNAYTAGEETDTVVITAEGMNQIWDYRNIKTERFTTALLEYLEPSGGFRADLFPGANFRQRISASTDEGSFLMDSYMNISSNILRTLGSASDFAGFSFTEIEDDDAAPLPMTYGTNWLSVTIDTSDEFGFRTITNDSTWNIVDGSGTLRLSIGDFECLRLKEMSKSITESSFNGLPIGPPDTTFSESYIWLSKNHLQTFIVDGLEDNLGEVSMTISGAPTSVEETYSKIPRGYALSQNYPNPFNPSTSISYSIPSDGQVTLAIYDVLGNEVAVLESGYKSAGNYSLSFDANNLTSGIYFYTIKAGSFTSTKKMLLMK
jgi:hypothetical protein